MDKNAIQGLVLMALLTIVYFVYFAPKPPTPPPAGPENKTEQVENSTANPGEEDTQTPVAELSPEVQDSLQQAKKVSQFGSFAALTEGTAKDIQVLTDRFDLSINTKGASINRAYLNDYKTFDSLPLPIIDEKLPNTIDNLIIIVKGKIK
ncbi:MAG: hypothetical protein AAF696_33030, partial [Bacteroidota bacterium]